MNKGTPFQLILALTFSAQLWAQSPSLQSDVNNVIDVLSQENLQLSIKDAQELSLLEDQNNINSCSEFIDISKEPSCQGMANSFLPAGYKEKSWKTLFEIKYQAIDPQASRSTARANYNEINFNSYRNLTGDPEKPLNSKDDLDTEANNIMNWYKEKWGVEFDPFDVKAQLIMDQLSNPDFFKDLSVKESNELMFKRLEEYTKAMSDQEYLRFISSVAGFVDYNDERADFKQKEGAGLGIVTPFEQVTGTGSGVCGDIHSMAAKMGEARGWETFTVGYMLDGSQHVVTAMVNPNEPDKLMLVNYGRYEEADLKNGEWINPTPIAGTQQELGMQLRIFKNKKTGDPMGQMQQIATIPTALGSFMNDLFKREDQISKAMSSNNNYQVVKAGGETSRHKVKLKNDGDKIVDKLAGEGIVVYQGEVNNAHVYGVAVSHDVYKTIYRWDETEKKCVPKKNKYFSMGVAGSLVDLPLTDFDQAFYVYLNMKGGQIFHVYQTEHFQFKGVIGYELEAIMSNAGEAYTGDGNFTTLMGVVADYNKNGTKIHTSLTYETNFGLRNQNLMTDLSTIPKNVNPMSFNAISLDANLSKQIGPKTSFVTNNNVTFTRVGGRVFLSTGIIHGNTSIMASYQGGVKALPIGNSLQNVNLLQNYNNMDGFRLTAGHNFTTKKGTFSGNISGYGGFSTSTETPQFMGGASLKLNINGNKKRKPAGN